MLQKLTSLSDDEREMLAELLKEMVVARTPFASGSTSRCMPRIFSEFLKLSLIPRCISVTSDSCYSPPKVRN